MWEALKAWINPTDNYQREVFIRRELEEYPLVDEDILPDTGGVVKGMGTYWKAKADQYIPKGTRVKVLKRDKLTLFVCPI